MPRKGLTRRLRLVRAAHTLAARVIGLRGVQVATVSPTASVRIHRPSAITDVALPAVLWIHGGGFVPRVGTAGGPFSPTNGSCSGCLGGLG